MDISEVLCGDLGRELGEARGDGGEDGQIGQHDEEWPPGGPVRKWSVKMSSKWTVDCNGQSNGQTGRRKNINVMFFT